MTDEKRSEGEDRAAWVSFDEGKTWSDAKVLRFKPWRWEVVLIAGLSMLIGAVGWNRTDTTASQAKIAAINATEALDRVEGFAIDLRDSAVRGCQRQNEVRKQQHVVQDILRDVLQDDIKEQRHPDPAILELLGLTPEEIEGVSDKKIKKLQEHRQELNHKLKLAPCDVAYPSTDNEGEPR